jgi:hypothetical protein
VKLRRWSRGILAIVRGGGHIEQFSPLYKSEGPTQVCSNLCHPKYSVCQPQLVLSVPIMDLIVIGGTSVDKLLNEGT